MVHKSSQEGEGRMQMKLHSWNKLIWKHRQVGYLRDDFKIFKKVVTDAHYFKKYKGFAISTDILDALERKGTEEIRIVWLDGNSNPKVQYQVSLEQWRDKSDYYFNGNDVQEVLALSDMEKVWERNKKV